MPTTIKLQQPAREYFRFQDNQVLTAGQLNRLIDYFETQHRLTRTCLVGVGIACGLKLQINEAADAIVVSSGCGVTTDGDLIHLPQNKTLKEFAVFEDNKAKYPAFWDKDSDTQRFELWELVDGTQDEDREVHPLTDFTGETNVDLEDMVVLAYLDNYARSLDICSPQDCNNQGEEQVADLRFLLIRSTDARTIIEESDAIYRKYGNLLKSYFNLPRLRAPRVAIDGKAAASYRTLVNAYAKAIGENRERLLNGLNDLASGFGAVLDPDGAVEAIAWEKHFDDFFPTTISGRQLPIAFQYRYGHYEDLVQAYTEIRDELYEVLVECLPAVDAFPHHLMLGLLSAVEPSADISFRHHFYPSPVNTNNDRRLLQVQSLYLRLNYLMTDYTDPQKLFDDLRVTPSLKASTQLSEKAIPYYYDVSADLLENWNIKNTQRGQEEETLSYHADKYSEEASVRSPLDFEHEGNDFYRVEGHLGRSYGDALDELIKLRSEKGLTFDIVALRLGAESTEFNLEDYRYFFQDLEALLDAWKAEQTCLSENAAGFFSAFSMEEPGTHLNYTGGLTINPILTTGMRRASTPTMFSGRTNLGIATGGVFNVGTVSAGSVETFGITSNIATNLLTATNLNLAKLTPTATATTASALSGAVKGDTIFTPVGGVAIQNRTVKDSIVADDKAIGKQVKGVFDQKISISGPEWRESILDNVYKGFEEKGIDIATLSPTDLVIGVEVPVNIISRLQYMADQQPEDLSDLTPESIAAYKKAIADLVSSVQRAKREVLARINEDGYEEKGYERDYLLLLNQLELNACAAKKIEVLMDEFLRRREQILELTNLSNYATKHPGLEHKGGVPTGGTFVMVYKDEEAQTGLVPPITVIPGLTPVQPIAPIAPKLDLLKGVSNAISPKNFAVTDLKANLLQERSQKLALRKGLSIKRASEKVQRKELTKRPDEFAKYLIDNHKLINVENTIKDYQLVTGVSNNLVGLIQGAVFEGITLGNTDGFEPNVSRYTVIADFCLPYRCCSDLPPMVFVLPRQRVDLRLPVAFICIKEDLSDAPGRLPFEVTPTDGVVEPDVDNAELVVRDGERYFFEPSAVTEDLLNSTIRFTVNDQETDTSLRIYRRPEPEFEVNLKTPSEKGELVIVPVSLENSTVEKEGEKLTWNWSFGDGNTSREKSPTHTYQFSFFELQDSNELTIRLIVTNGECSETKEEKITIDLSSLIKVDPECMEKGMKVIETDGQVVIELLQKPLFLKEVAFSKTLQSFYKKLDDEKSRTLYFSGRLNGEIFGTITELAAVMEEYLSSQTEDAASARAMSAYLLRLLLALIGCQEGLREDFALQSLLNDFYRHMKIIRSRFPKYFEEGTGPGFEGALLIKYLKQYLAETKIKDIQILSRIQRILEVITS
ncbi:PKD domain-containing protein [Flavilitoribacter nigricans]|uniref:PKD domain-containing protein n=1 Tax=Flavilitoribacter nigricans (strain ATCC 23147 / DSM 23189 / NBRC 102662 / NCIMB 1420 / SS-2) TaxID=1122177 RepID=A0A2D0NDU6_FLAN2|nr:PKD domain-containing protein [Flavilitoribacter nigricans]PHN06359.1 hypothetical protein CRP01_12375 [Flavilitoribacter nigricans DSM 23189 = NBRC 102662]